MDFTIGATSAFVSPGNTRSVTVELSGVDVEEVIDAIGLETVLNSIGEGDVRKHFGIKED